MSNLTQRKERILKAVVEDYISYAEPVSSGEIKERHLNDFSSATIRNELAALEEMGYLYQPHTSAGRIPTKAAYQLYVDQLMPKRKLTRSELNLIKGYFNEQMLQMSEVLKRTAKVISEVTHYASLAFVNDISNAVIENIKVVKLTSFTALVIVITDMGVLKDATITLESDFDESYFEAVSRLATQVMGGKTITEIKQPEQIVNGVIEEYRKIFDTIIEIIKKYENAPSEFVLEGASKLLEYPEYSSINKARAVVSLLETKEQLLPVLKSDGNVEFSINIGKDDTDTLSDCAVITATYRLGGRNIGQAGVIGPLRMDYSKVVSVLDFVTKTLSGINIIENSPSLKDDKK